MSAVACTIGVSIISGVLTGLIMKIPLLELVKSEDMFEGNSESINFSISI